MQSNLNGHDSGRFRTRFKISFAVISIMLSLLIIRMWHLQVIRGDELSQRSENNSVRLRKIRPLRGLIMDTNRQVLVDNQPSFDIVFMPNRSRNIQDMAKKLKNLYEESSLAFSMEFPSPGKKRFIAPVKLEKNINKKKLAVIETHALDLPGVAVEVVPIRQYLGGEMMAHIIGYTGEVSREDLEKDESGESGIGDITGKNGIEKYLDPYLKGKSGAEQVEVNVLGKEIKLVGRIQPVPGYNVMLTIDASLQKVAWEALKDMRGSVVAMDPRDGSVLALVSTPSFDPNLFNGGISIEDWENLSTDPSHPMENRAVAGQYPPGSTYKLIVAAAALEEGLITPDTTFFCNGSFELGNRTYRCWQKKGHGHVNLHRAIVESCDVYFYNLGKLIGVDKLAEYARGFGLGSASGIDLPREKGGLIPTKQWKLSRFRESWQMGETISLAIGQGYNLLTPLQLVNAYAALANGGVIYRPRLIKSIETMDGRVIKSFEPEQKGKIPISKKNMEILRYALWGVVNENGGTGHALRRKEADVCGKTGTSQVIGLPEDEKARKRKINLARFRDHALFVCFAPYKNPEIAIAVIVENAGHGGSVAAPIARKIIDAYFERKNKRPDKHQPVLAVNQKALTGTY
ncbi:MAG: penicillin-binding protein 2 [Deltaproteobacteria bacterium]|nr:penicillin-binding protein 2 [Deltaproteobacteria bacterium]